MLKLLFILLMTLIGAINMSWATELTLCELKEQTGNVRAIEYEPQVGQFLFLFENSYENMSFLDFIEGNFKNNKWKNIDKTEQLIVTKTDESNGFFFEYQNTILNSRKTASVICQGLCGVKPSANRSKK